MKKYKTNKFNIIICVVTQIFYSLSFLSDKYLFFYELPNNFIKSNMSNRSFFLFLYLFALILNSECTYTLVWSDEFNAASLNTTNWNVEVTSTVYNNELEAYTANNVAVANGTLILTAQKQSSGGQSYTSGRINSQNKKYFVYGKIEASIKMPLGQGFWPAFWLLPQVDSSMYTELDIMEAIGQYPGQFTGTCYPGGDVNAPPGWQGTYTFPTGSNFYSAFHTYGVQWTPSTMAFYVDGKYYFNCTKANTDPTIWSFDNDQMFIIFNLAVGGNDPGSPSSSTPFPSKMYVDWVRVYQDTTVPGTKMVFADAPKTPKKIKKNIKHKALIQESLASTSCSMFTTSSLKGAIQYLTSVGKINTNTIGSSVVSSSDACCNLCATTSNCIALKIIASTTSTTCTLYSK